MSNDFCRCGAVKPTATIWHSWRVDWKNMPQKIRDWLKYEYLCEDCKTNVKTEIKNCLQILDNSKSAEGDNSQLLWNDEYEELRGGLLYISSIVERK